MLQTRKVPFVSHTSVAMFIPSPAVLYLPTQSLCSPMVAHYMYCTADSLGSTELKLDFLVTNGETYVSLSVLNTAELSEDSREFLLDSGTYSRLEKKHVHLSVSSMTIVLIIINISTRLDCVFTLLLCNVAERMLV